jgi:pyridoxine 5-phosphate synthase
MTARISVVWEGTTKVPRLGVNIDHVATVRQARGGDDPDPVWAAVLAEQAGAEGITVHLREDRRHIQDEDLRRLKIFVKTRLNLEMSIEPAIVEIAIATRPQQVTLVPERRAELTTEGGLDVVGQRDRVAEAVRRLHDAGLEVSLFLDPDLKQIEVGAALRVAAVELHTGRYAEQSPGIRRRAELDALIEAGAAVRAAGMALHAGHGLNYVNVGDVAAIEGMAELNIGHSIVSRALFVGFETAVREMVDKLRQV